MKRLFAFEAKKLLKDKAFIALCIFALALQCVLTFFALDGDLPDLKTTENAYALYSSDAAAFEAREEELYKAVAADPFSDDAHIRALVEEYVAMISAREAAGKPQQYRGTLSVLIRNAEKQIAEFKSTGIPESAYIYKPYSNTADIYSPLLEANIEYEYIHGWDEYFSLSFPGVFILAAVILAVARIMSYEKLSSSVQVVTATAKGRGALAVSKLFLSAAAAAVAALVFSLVPLLQTALALGLSSGGNSVHALKAFVLAPFECSVAVLLLKTLALRVLAACAVAALAAFVYSLSRSAILSVSLCGVAVGLDSALAPQGGLQYLAFAESAFGRYRPVNIFGFCFDATGFSTAAAFVAAVALFFAAFAFLRRRAYKSNPRSKIKLPRMRIPKSLLGFELYKLNVKEKAALIMIAALAVRAVLCFALFTPDDSATEYFYKKYIASFGGVVTEETLEDIRAEHELQVYYSEFDLRHADPSLSAEEHEALSKNVVLSAYRLPAIKRVSESAERVFALDGAELVYDTGWKKLFSLDFDYVAVFAIMLAASLFLTRERECGAFCTVAPTVRGGRALGLRQSAALVITSAVFLAAEFAIAFAVFSARYDLPSGGAALQSLGSFPQAGGISINAFCALAAACIFVKTLFAALLFAFVALAVKRFYLSFSLCALLVYIPYFAVRAGLEVINPFTVGGQLSFGILPSVSGASPVLSLMLSTAVCCAVCTVPRIIRIKN